jgi:hypothetical protein
MYAGHFAAALVIKKHAPAAPSWGLFLGVGVLDVLFGPLVLAGIERVTVTPGGSPGFSLDYIDWSHSLLMSVVWAVLYAALFLGRSRSVAIAMGLAVFSHFLLDLPMHPPDLALWPNADVHLGAGLWQRLPSGWWFVELGVIAACWWYYSWRMGSDSQPTSRPVVIGLAIVVLHVVNSPWLSAF